MENKNQKTYTKRLILKSFILFFLIISLSLLTIYINRINIICPLTISTYTTKHTNESIKIVGTSPLGRNFELKKDSNNQWNTSDYYLNSLNVSIQNTSGFGDTLALCYSFDNESSVDTIYLDMHKSYQKIPITTIPTFWEKFWFLLQKVLKNTFKNLSIIPFLILLFFILYFIKSKIEKPEVLFYKTLFYTLLGVLFLISFYTVPNPEDYQISLYAREYGGKLPFVFYHFTDGRYLTNWMYVFLNPLFWGDEKIYFLSSMISISAIVLSIMYAIKKIFKSSNTNTILIGGTIFIIFTNNLFSYSYLFFWMASSYVYAFIVFFINILLGITYSYFDSNSKSKYFTLKISILLFLFIGLNEISIIISFIYGFILLLLLLRFKKVSIIHIPIYVVIIASTLIVFLSTGNDLRSFSSNYTSLSDRFEVEYIIKTIQTTYVAIFDLLFKIVTNIPLIINLCIFVFILNKSTFIAFKITSKIRIAIILLFLALSFGISFLFIFSIDNSSDLPERISNIILYLFILTFVFSCLNLKLGNFSSIFPNSNKINITIRYSLIFISLMMFNSNNGLFRIFAEELVTNKLNNYYQSKMNTLATYKNNTNSFTYLKVNPTPNNSSILFCQDVFSNAIFCNDIKNYFNNYNLLFINPNSPNKNTYSISEKERINQAPLLLIPYESAANRGNKKRTLTLFRFAKMMENSKTSTKNNLAEIINIKNLVDEAIKIDTSVIDIIPDSIYAFKNLQNNEISLKMVTCLWEYFPKHITKIRFKFQFTICTYSDINTGLNFDLQIKYDNDSYINKIYLKNFYDDFIPSKQHFFNNQYSDSLKFLEFSTSFNPYDTTLQINTSFIKNPNSSFRRLKIEYSLTNISNSIKIPMSTLIDVSNTNSNFQEILFSKIKKINFQNKNEKRLIYYLSTVKLYSKINKITFL